MKNKDYSSILPHPDCPPEDALYAIIDKLPIFFRYGYFESPNFIVTFHDRLMHIVQSFPDDESRKELEIEVAHIQHAISTHGIVLFSDPNKIKIDAIEQILRDAGVFEQYQRYSDGVHEEGMIIDVDLFERYLDYLYYSLHDSIDNAERYIKTVLRFSQLHTTMISTIMAHLKGIYSIYDREQVEIFRNRYSYLGGVDASYDKRVLDTLQYAPTGTRDDAKTRIHDTIDTHARLHIFLENLSQKNILPSFRTLPYQRKQYISNLVNSLKDIIDPEQLIPIFFYDGDLVPNTIPTTQSQQGRVLH